MLGSQFLQVSFNFAVVSSTSQFGGYIILNIQRAMGGFLPKCRKVIKTQHLGPHSSLLQICRQLVKLYPCWAVIGQLQLTTKLSLPGYSPLIGPLQTDHTYRWSQLSCKDINNYSLQSCPLLMSTKHSCQTDHVHILEDVWNAFKKQALNA